MKSIVYISGSCNAKTRIGAYSYVIDGKQQKIGGGVNTTIRRMELTALIKAIESMKKTDERKEITLVTRSSYIPNAMKNYRAYRANNMHTLGGQELANQDLWDKLIQVAKERNVFITCAK